MAINMMTWSQNNICDTPKDIHIHVLKCYLVGSCSLNVCGLTICLFENYELIYFLKNDKNEQCAQVHDLRNTSKSFLSDLRSSEIGKEFIRVLIGVLIVYTFHLSGTSHSDTNPR